MKTTIGTKRYSSDKCETLGTIDHYSRSGNYSGETRLVRASDGKLLVLTTGNGHDFHVQDSFRPYDDDYLSLADFDLTDEQELRCEVLNLVELVK